MIRLWAARRAPPYSFQDVHVRRISHATQVAKDNGKDIRARFVWSDITADSARWEQAFSVNGERTWITNWIMEFTRSPE